MININFLPYSVTYWNKKKITLYSQNLIKEEPLSIIVQGKPYAVVMRTPGDEIAHAAGFCLSEGIIENKSDISVLSFCGEETNAVTITLSEDRRLKIKHILDRQTYLSQTSCGICGKEIINDICQILSPFLINNKIIIEVALNCIEKLSDFQVLRKKTRASHAAAIFNNNGELLSIAEDVGRHNALDKVIGKLFLEQKIDSSSFIVLSSRISYELVQKAARAKIPFIIAVSRPTELAVKLACELNMTIACLSKDGGLYIFSGKDRLQITC
ncbi:MAG: formate dehydrogenase accessory sulfurtransferase FdhD [Desulfobacterales bacterium]|nr:formate dehydrogenase accessory sulfurtransferase FdhD [Desulfobacterales bacterium]MBF0396959.1 formate dehydrogenase accessory sulfurtransferase FdhD [Desulfobacterales bacterium]